MRNHAFSHLFPFKLEGKEVLTDKLNRCNGLDELRNPGTSTY